ncbi:hypothetical protein CDL12_07860 [Handroanthus impetiginosus]|uniref:Uncharacterized protein n=1 Tax=Handroanthus impetiginosus TaxID=429701 RepID=A0A2G9HPK8_9LAMI|nr:hypothetical protein CDL12_07860 [Handroanthus impetiginosus]
MEQKLYSLKGATIALTEFQKPERFSSREEFQLSRPSNDPAEVKEFPADNSTSKKGQSTDDQDNTPTLVENGMSDYPTSTLTDTVAGNLPSGYTTTFASTDVDIGINLAKLILVETEDAITRICADVETYLSALNSDIHNAISLYKELVQDLIKDVSDMRKDVKELKGNPGNLQAFNDMIPLGPVLKHENQLLILQEIRNELVEINNGLGSMSACFYKAMNTNCLLNFNESFTGTDGWTTDCSSSFPYSSVESVDNDDKLSSMDRHKCTSKAVEKTLELNSDEGSNLSHKGAVLLLTREFMKVNETFVKLKNHLVAFSISKMSRDCMVDILSISDPHALEPMKEQRGYGHNQPTTGRAEVGTKSFRELAVEEKHDLTSGFFAKFEEANATLKEADYMLKAMLKANEDANALTALWKETGEELMADKARLSAEIKELKSHVLSRNGEEEVLPGDIKFSLAEEANVLSLPEECSLAMQTFVEELFEIARSDAIQVVEQMQLFFCSLRSSLEDIMCKAIQNDISIYVLQCQMGEYCDEFRRLNAMSTSDRSTLLEHCLVADNFELSCAGRDDGSALHPVKCESKGYQIADVPRKEIKDLDLLDGDTVNKKSELQRELEQKDILLKGLLLDFSLLQEFASHRKDVKDELEKLIVATSEVQDELQIKRVELDDLLVQKTKLESRLSEAEQALFNSNSELDQAKGALDSLSEQNDELKDLLKDLYLKNAEAEQLLKDQRDAIKSLEKEIIRVSSVSEKQLAPSLEDIEDALTEMTAERDHLVEKLNSLQDKLDITSALADENQAIAAEARQESEASKMHAEQKEEEVKILERSVEELESTINVLEKKVHGMEEEVEKQRLIRDSLELELQSLRHRLLTVEDLTESMTSKNSNTALLEDQLARKLHVRSLEINEAHSRIRFLEEENARQSKEITQFKDYISELVLHAEAQASQYQQKYKSLEAMLHEVKTDLSNVYAAPTLERSDKISARTRGSSSPFRCIVGLVQQMNQEKDQELSSARLRIEELEALAAGRYKEVCMLNTRLATAESMTHDVIRDLLSVKLDISNYADMVDQHQIEKLIEEAHHRRQEFVGMEQETVSLRSQIDDLLEERERCIAEINRNKADQLATEIVVEQLQEREQFLHAQNEMLKMDKSNLQKRITELDDMVKKLFSMQNTQPQTSSSVGPFDYDLRERLAYSQKVLSRINNQLAQYRKPDGSSCPDDKREDRHGDQTKFRKQKP